MAICYLIGAGDFDAKIEIGEKDMIIAADGGYDLLIQHGYTPNLLIGDFDSISSKLPERVETIRFKSEKDETDMFLAYMEGVKRGYTSFVIHGALGGRLDHTLANISLLAYAKEHGHTSLITDGKQNIICIKNEKITLMGAKGKYLSVFAYGGDAMNVSIRGAKYETVSATLTPSFPLGVSNEFTDSPCEISVGAGTLIIIYEIDQFSS